jgi:hypothetical protein
MRQSRRTPAPAGTRRGGRPTAVEIDDRPVRNRAFVVARNRMSSPISSRRQPPVPAAICGLPIRGHRAAREPSDALGEVPAAFSLGIFAAAGSSLQTPCRASAGCLVDGRRLEQKRAALRRGMIRLPSLICSRRPGGKRVLEREKLQRHGPDARRRARKSRRRRRLHYLIDHDERFARFEMRMMWRLR